VPNKAMVVNSLHKLLPFAEAASADEIIGCFVSCLQLSSLQLHHPTYVPSNELLIITFQSRTFVATF
jgi:hypothetical protein